MKSIEWKWGLTIGAAGFVWLVASWAFGFHRSGIGMIQVAAALGMAITFVLYALAMHALMRRETEVSLLEGLRSGALIGVVSAILAVAGQYVYFHWINPGWTTYMVGETRKHYTDMGLEEARLAEIAEGARITFGFSSYATQAAVGSIVQGVLFSLLSVTFLKWRSHR